MTNIQPKIGPHPPLLPTIKDDLRRQVFTHSSVASPNNPSYERLAALGDASLTAAATRILYDHPNRLDAAAMAGIREVIISRETVLNWGKAYRLIDQVSGQRIYGEAARDNITIAIFKAYLGAIVVSSSVEAMGGFLQPLIMPLVDAMLRKVQTPSEGENADLLRVFHERITKLDMLLPKYEINGQDKNGNLIFSVQCILNGKVVGQGSGRSKLEAKRAAAKAASELSDNQLKGS